MNKLLQKFPKKTKHIPQGANDDIYIKALAVRPFILKTIRSYENFEYKYEYIEHLQVTYNKAKKMLVDIDIEIKIIESEYVWDQVYQYKTTYLKKFKKNLKNIKKLCEDTSIILYTLFPNKIPFDVRTLCVQEISPATI